MTQYEQENDLGRGGGEVDDETLEEAWQHAEERGGPLEREDLDPGDETAEKQT